MMSIAKELGNAFKGEGVNVANLIPINAAKNVVKGWQATQDTIKTGRGQPLLPKQDAKFGLKQALGFTPVELARSRESLYYNNSLNRSPEIESQRSILVRNLKGMQGASSPDVKEGFRQKVIENIKEIARIKKDMMAPFNYNMEISNALRKIKEDELGRPLSKKVTPLDIVRQEYYGKLKDVSNNKTTKEESE